jgi:hypothetical protein
MMSIDEDNNKNSKSSNLCKDEEMNDSSQMIEQNIQMKQTDSSE